MADKKSRSSKKTAASRAAAETSATAPRAGTARAGRPAAGIAPARLPRPIDPLAIPATRQQVEAVRSGKEKADNKVPMPRPAALSPRATILNPGDEKTTSPAADVVDIQPDEKRQAKGYREETVVATRMGYYGLKRRRAGEVFPMAFTSSGYLPSWVKLANKEDQDPEVARSRQVVRNSTGQEIIDDVTRDAGTVVPTYLGGNQRRPTNQSGDVL